MNLKKIKDSVHNIKSRQEFIDWLKSISREDEGRYEVKVSGDRVLIVIEASGSNGYWTNAFVNGKEVFDEYESDIAVLPSIEHFDLNFKEDAVADEFTELFNKIRSEILQIAPTSAKVKRIKKGFTVTTDMSIKEPRSKGVLQKYEDNLQIIFEDQVSIGPHVLKSIYHWVDSDVRSRIEFIEKWASDMEQLANDAGLTLAKKFIPDSYEYLRLDYLYKEEEKELIDNFTKTLDNLDVKDGSVSYRLMKHWNGDYVIAIWVTYKSYES